MKPPGGAIRRWATDGWSIPPTHVGELVLDSGQSESPCPEGCRIHWTTRDAEWQLPDRREGVVSFTVSVAAPTVATMTLDSIYGRNSVRWRGGLRSFASIYSGGLKSVLRFATQNRFGCYHLPSRSRVGAGCAGDPRRWRGRHCGSGSPRSFHLKETVGGAPGSSRPASWRDRWSIAATIRLPLAFQCSNSGK